MTNKYLEKIAAKMHEEKDVAKAFAQTSAAGYAGHGAGMVVGGAGAALLAAKNKKFGAFAQRVVDKAKNYGARAEATRVGKFLGKHTGGGGPAGIAGAITGGFAGEEIAQYATVRHNVMKEKQRKQGQ